jgi:hypothetical protein
VIKFTTKLDQGGHLYRFGLSETDLNRLEFNKEPIFFDFGYAGYPHLFGVILYMSEYEEPENVLPSMEQIKARCLPLFEAEQGVTLETLRVFLIARSILSRCRSTFFHGFSVAIEISHPQDKQVFFAGRTDEEIAACLVKEGLLSSYEVN